MNVSSVGNTYSPLQSQALQRTPEAAEVQKAGGDNDGDSDDQGAKVVQSPPAPTVNLNGEKIGQLVNITA
jgi:hypothetical protein